MDLPMSGMVTTGKVGDCSCCVRDLLLHGPTAQHKTVVTHPRPEVFVEGLTLVTKLAVCLKKLFDLVQLFGRHRITLLVFGVILPDQGLKR